MDRWSGKASEEGTLRPEAEQEPARQHWGRRVPGRETGKGKSVARHSLGAARKPSGPQGMSTGARRGKEVGVPAAGRPQHIAGPPALGR